MMSSPSSPVPSSASTDSSLPPTQTEDIPTPSDHALLLVFVREDSPAAFRELTERFTGLVYGVARRRTGSHEIAEEVTQNVFAILARKAHGLVRKETPPGAWLHRVAVLESSQAMRRESTRQRIMETYSAHQELASPADAVVVANSILPDLDEALNLLSGTDRELLLARYFSQQSYRDIANATGRSEAALMQQQHRALHKLSQLLRRNGHAVTVAVLAPGLITLFTTPAPAGLASICAVHATCAALTPGACASSQLLSFALAMQTKTQFTILTAGLCLLVGTGSFLTARQLHNSMERLAVPPGAASGGAQKSSPDTEHPNTATAPAMTIPTTLEVLTAEGRERVEKLALWLTAASPADMDDMLENLTAMKPGPAERTERGLIFQRWVEIDRPGAFAACRKFEGSTWTACEAWGRANPKEAWPATSKMDRFERKYVLQGIIETDPLVAAGLLEKGSAGGMMLFDSQLHELIADQLAAKSPAEGWAYALKHDANSQTAVDDWVRKDPDGAVAFALGQSTSRLRALALPSLIWELGNQHPEKLASLLDVMPEGRLKWKAATQQARLLASGDPEAALARVRQQTNPSTRTLMLQELASSWAESKPQEALAVLRTLDWTISGDEFETPQIITASTPLNCGGASKAAESLHKLAAGGHLDEARAVAEAMPAGPKQEQALGAVASGWPADRVYELSEWIETQEAPSVREAGARAIVHHLMGDKAPDFEAAARWAATLSPSARGGEIPLVEVMKAWRKADSASANESLKGMTVPQAVLKALETSSPPPP